MASDEIKIWAMDASGGATPLALAQQTETEQKLEDVLVVNPEMLLPGLTLVGRQTRTDGGPLDLLGVDEDGRLVVFELKRGTLSRDAVAQAIDYASYLDAMPEQELANYISQRSGSHGVENIENFEEWYDARTQGQESASLKPVRMVLVGLGVDERTARMAHFLADGGIDISLLTFHGFSESGRTLLARQVQVKPEIAPTPGNRPARSRPPQRELIQGVETRIMQHKETWEEGYLVWNAVRQMFRETFANPRERVARTTREWTLYRLNFCLTKRRGHSAAVQLSPEGLMPWGQRVEVIFFPTVVQLCLEKFTQLRKEIPYSTHPMDDPAKEAGVLEVKFLMKSMSDWETHKEKLAAVAKSVYEANEALLMGEDD